MGSDKSSEAISAQVAFLLREERAKQNLSLSELSARAGLSRQMVSYVEQEKRNPSLNTMLRITKALKINLDDVIRCARLTVERQKSK